MDHCRVVAAAELASDFRVAAGGQDLGQIHRHLPGTNHRAGAPLRTHFLPVDPVKLADRALDLVDRDAPAVCREDVGA